MVYTLIQAQKVKLLETTRILTKVNITQPGSKFYATKSNNVDHVKFENSVVIYFSNEVCILFPNLSNLYAELLSMKEIEKYALQRCTKLTQVYFGKNHLETLDQNLFEGSPNLQYISFEQNRLKSINAKTFGPVKNLRELHLGKNLLAEFVMDNFPILQNLTHLSLHSNNLTDLDEQSFVQKFYNLQSIYLQNNLFVCDRLKVIISTLKSKGVTLEGLDEFQLPRSVASVENVRCVVKPKDTSINFSMIIGVGVLLILFDVLLVIGYFIWRKYF